MRKGRKKEEKEPVLFGLAYFLNSSFLTLNFFTPYYFTPFLLFLNSFTFCIRQVYSRLFS